VTPERPVLRYFGGKWLLAPWIISHFPPHRVYVEPFGGGASVLMRKPRAHAEIYNDLNSEIVNVFRVMRDPTLSALLTAQLKNTPWARAEFELSYEPSSDPVEQARRTICRAFMGHGATGACRDGKTGFRAKCYEGNGTQSYTFGGYADHIEAFRERLRGVIIENKDAFTLWEQHDSKETLWFVDPPYVHDTRNYKHGYKYELLDEDHVRLAGVLGSLKGMVVLCGYPNRLYETLGWDTVSIEAKTDSNAMRTEVLWLNHAAVKAQAQQSLFGGVS
jgi:DNA adenine methylase